MQLDAFTESKRQNQSNKIPSSGQNQVFGTGGEDDGVSNEQNGNDGEYFGGEESAEAFIMPSFLDIAYAYQRPSSGGHNAHHGEVIVDAVEDAAISIQSVHGEYEGNNCIDNGGDPGDLMFVQLSSAFGQQADTTLVIHEADRHGVHC